MAINRSTGVLFGTNESTGANVANNATGSGAEVDILGPTTPPG